VGLGKRMPAHGSPVAEMAGFIPWPRYLPVTGHVPHFFACRSLAAAARPKMINSGPIAYVEPPELLSSPVLRATWREIQVIKSSFLSSRILLQRQCFEYCRSGTFRYGRSCRRSSRYMQLPQVRSLHYCWPYSFLDDGWGGQDDSLHPPCPA
jgi:hypothetical protein